MGTSLEDRKRDFRMIYEVLYEDFRAYIKTIARSLRINPDTAGRRFIEALEEEYICLPQLRRKSYINFREHISLVRCKRSLPLFKQYTEDRNVVYHAAMSGFANLWITSKKKFDSPGEIIVEGIRSDYYVPHTPNCSWNTSIRIMRRMIEKFDLKNYKPQGIIETHWNETLDWWDSDFEKLFREFKYNGRKKFQPTMRKYHISSNKISRLLEYVNQCCTVFLRFYPEGALAYDPYLIMFETDYEDFIIELFSQLPTTPLFFKISNKLFVQANVERLAIRKVGLDMSSITNMHLLHIIEELLNRRYGKPFILRSGGCIGSGPTVS